MPCVLCCAVLMREKDFSGHFGLHSPGVDLINILDQCFSGNFLDFVSQRKTIIPEKGQRDINIRAKHKLNFQLLICCF